MKINPSVKVSLVAAAIGLAGYLGFWAYSEISVGNFNPPPLVPGNANLVAFKTGGKLRIRVANRIANLVETSGNNDEQRGSDVSEADIDAKRIPIREFLQSLQGNEKALSKFIMTLNELDGQDLIPYQAIPWNEEDLKKALDGDPVLQKKLEQDIHIGLDGIPPKTIRMSSIQNGIVVEIKVPVQIKIGGQVKTVVGVAKEAFRPRFVIEFEKAIKEEFEPSDAFLAGNYSSMASKLWDGTEKPDEIKGALQNLISEERKKRLAAKPEQLLQGAQVLVTDNLFTSATFRNYKDDRKRDYYDLILGVNEEGKKRLWKYSRNTNGFELLVVIDGIAIAAPRITTPLNGNSVTIKGLQDKALVEKAVATINGTKPGQ